MENASVIKIRYYPHKEKQLLRRYLFIVITASLMLVSSFFSGEKFRPLILLYSFNGYISVLITGIVHLYTRLAKKDFQFALQFTGYYDLLTIIIIEEITVYFLDIYFSPLLLLAIMSLTAKMMLNYAKEDIDIDKVKRENIFATIFFLFCIALAEFLILPVLFGFKMQIFVTVSKMLVASSPYYFMIYVYSVLIIGYKKELSRANTLNEKLVKSMRFIITGEIFNTFVHDLKNMYQAVYVSMYDLEYFLKKNNIRDDEKCVEKLVDNVGKMDAILKNFLKYTRLDPSKKETVDVVKAIVDGLAYLNLNESSCRDINISVINKKNISGTIVTSRYRMMSLFLNIITNAIYSLKLKPAVQEKNIDIIVDEIPEGLEVQICDNGPGIKNEDLPKIFGYYTTKEGGSGIGLKLSQDYVVNELKGNIEVESEPGEKTVFRISIPVKRNSGVTN